MLKHVSAIANAFDVARNENTHNFLRLDRLFKKPSLSEEALGQQQQGPLLVFLRGMGESVFFQFAIESGLANIE